MRNENRNRNKNQAENSKGCVLTQTHATQTTQHTPQLELTMCFCCDAAPKTNAHCPSYTHTHIHSGRPSQVRLKRDGEGEQHKQRDKVNPQAHRIRKGGI